MLHKHTLIFGVWPKDPCILNQDWLYLQGQGVPLPASADGSLGPGGPRGAAASGGAGIQNMQNIQGGIGAVSIGDREAAMLAQQSQYDNIGHHLHHHGAGRDPHGPPAPSTPQGFHRTLSQPQGGPSPSLSAKSKLSQVRFFEQIG